MLTDKEKKAIERIEDFLTTNIIISISSDETADSEELKAFISKNEYLAIEFIATTFLKQSKEIEELKEEQAKRQWVHIKENGEVEPLFYISKDKIKAKIEEVKDGTYDAKIVLESLLEKENKNGK